jgi:hypothetical protein
MERRVFRRTPLPAAILAAIAGVSCGAGLHDANEAASTEQTVGVGESRIDFMGGRLDIFDGCLSEDGVPITFTWHRSIPHKGAVSAVYEISAPASGNFQKDMRISIATSDAIESDPNSIIGFLDHAETGDWWVPDQARFVCDEPGKVCGPVQVGIFSEKHLTSLELAILTKCSSDQPCPSGQSCAVGGVCQQCPQGSPCR